MIIENITTDDYFSDETQYLVWFSVLRKNIYCEQTELVNDLVVYGAGEEICLEEYHSAYIDGRLCKCSEIEAIKEWRCITKKLAEILKTKGEVVIDNKYGCWWGRHSLPTYEEDPVLLKIVEDLINNKISLGDAGKLFGNSKNRRRK